MSVGQNIDLVKKIYEAFSRGDLAAILNSLSVDVEWNYVGHKDIPLAGCYRGSREVEQFFIKIAQNQEVEDFGIDDIVAQDNKVIVLGYEVMKIKSTGLDFSTKWVHFFSFNEGKVCKFSEFSDTASVLKAYGR